MCRSTCAPGRLTGFVGGNGAGKTTTMRIVLGVLADDAGSVTLDGAPVTAADRRRFGYMPEERGLYPKMKVLEQIVYLARLHGYSKTDATTAPRALLEQLGLGERLDDNVETLSLGNQQRAQIAAALVHDPQVLILDEPFSGLDPLAVDVVAGVLQERAAARRRGAVLLPPARRRRAALRRPRHHRRRHDPRRRLPRRAARRSTPTRRYELVSAGDAGWLRDEPGVEVLDFDGGYAVFDADGDETAQRVLRRAVARGDVASFAPQHPTLAQIFKEVIQ